MTFHTLLCTTSNAFKRFRVPRICPSSHLTTSKCHRPTKVSSFCFFFKHTFDLSVWFLCISRNLLFKGFISDLGLTDSSPQFWCPEVDCAHERCSSRKDIPHEQNKIFEEISKECEHLLKQSDCKKCSVLCVFSWLIERKQDFVSGKPAKRMESPWKISSISLCKLSNTTFTRAKKVTEISFWYLSHFNLPGETKILSRKREQNKVAAARYRDKQKAKWQDLLNKRTAEEERNVKLKSQVSKLEEEVAAMRQKVLGAVRK